MINVFVLVEPPEDFAYCAGWHGYKAIIERETMQCGWPESEACGPFGWPHVEAFSLRYEVDDTLDHIAEVITMLRNEFQIADVTIEDAMAQL